MKYLIVCGPNGCGCSLKEPEEGNELHRSKRNAQTNAGYESFESTKPGCCKFSMDELKSNKQNVKYICQWQLLGPVDAVAHSKRTIYQLIPTLSMNRQCSHHNLHPKNGKLLNLKYYKINEN